MRSRFEALKSAAADHWSKIQLNYPVSALAVFVDQGNDLKIKSWRYLTSISGCVIYVMYSNTCYPYRGHPKERY